MKKKLKKMMTTKANLFGLDIPSLTHLNEAFGKLGIENNKKVLCSDRQQRQRPSIERCSTGADRKIFASAKTNEPVEGRV